jgi:hypothetical protein
VRLSHIPARTSAVFDDPNLVSHGGLVPVMALAERAGLPELLEGHVRCPSSDALHQMHCARRSSRGAAVIS